MSVSRRAMLTVAALGTAGVVASIRALRELSRLQLSYAVPAPNDSSAAGVSDYHGMQYRNFGSTDMKVSEIGFGSWAIGGNAYGSVARPQSLDALARAEELGCNFVDTAMVYGDAEEILGEFLASRRSKWLLASKYSGQKAGLQATLESQLRRLRTEAIDFYQIHWAPGRDEQALYEAMYRAKKAGKVRAIGVSLKSEQDIDFVLDHTQIDGFQLKFSLLDPYPFLARIARFRARRPAIVVRSSLREGFLTGKFNARTTFIDPNDQRSKLSPRNVADLVAAAEHFRFLESVAGSMACGAARYPLSFPEVSTVILGTKSANQAIDNFGAVPGATLPVEVLERIYREQKALGLHPVHRAVMDWLRRTLRR